MSHQHTPTLQGARIDVNDAFHLVCWARHFRVTQQRIRQAVQAVGADAAMVAAYLGHIGLLVHAAAHGADVCCRRARHRGHVPACSRGRGAGPAFA